MCIIASPGGVCACFLKFMCILYGPPAAGLRAPACLGLYVSIHIRTDESLGSVLFDFRDEGPWLWLSKP